MGYEWGIFRSVDLIEPCSIPNTTGHETSFDEFPLENLCCLSERLANGPRGIQTACSHRILKGEPVLFRLCGRSYLFNTYTPNKS